MVGLEVLPNEAITTLVLRDAFIMEWCVAIMLAHVALSFFGHYGFP